MFLMFFVNILLTQDSPLLNSTQGNKSFTMTLPMWFHIASITESKGFG